MAGETEPSTTRTVKLTGASDDLIELDGDIYEEFNLRDDEKGDLVAFSDGTVLRIAFSPDDTGNWRITPVALGSARLDVVQAVGEDGTDEATLTGDIRWAVHGVAYEKAKGA